MTPSVHFSNWMVCALVFLFFNQAAMSNRVTHFNIVNARNGRFVRRLMQGDVLSFPHPISLVAVAPRARRVTFTSPWYVVDETKPKFSFPKEREPNRLRPLRIGSKHVTIRAFADSKRNLAVSVKFKVLPFISAANKKPSFPPMGPLPSEITPSVADGFTDVAIPLIGKLCKKPSPVITSFKVDVEPRRDDYFELYVDWCPGQNPLRLRFLSYEIIQTPAGKFISKTTVLRSLRWNTVSFYRRKTLTFEQRCIATKIFVEVCGKRTGVAKPICVTSKLLDPRTPPLYEPRLASRGPFVLRLGSGDKAKIGYTIKPGLPSPIGYPNSTIDEKFRIQVMAVSKSGKTLGTSPWMNDRTISTTIPLKHRSLGVRPSEHDGGQVFLRYAYQSCPSNIGTLRAREATILSVKNSSPKLIRQDKKLPTMETLTYPPTMVGKPVTLTIKAKNDGKGLRSDNRATSLTYQWYKLEGRNFLNLIYPTKLDGETSSSLKLKEAECEVESCFRDGCSGLQRYHVAVCNTLGCMLSNTVVPNIVNENDCPQPFF